MKEEELLQNVKALALALRWKFYHTRDSRRSDPGFVDCVLVRERVVFVELKTMKGRVSQAQGDWLKALEDAGAEVYTFRPCCWNSGEIEQVLR